MVLVRVRGWTLDATLLSLLPPSCSPHYSGDDRVVLRRREGSVSGGNRREGDTSDGAFDTPSGTLLLYPLLLLSTTGSVSMCDP